MHLYSFCVLHCANWLGIVTWSFRFGHRLRSMSFSQIFCFNSMLDNTNNNDRIWIEQYASIHQQGNPVALRGIHYRNHKIAILNAIYTVNQTKRFPLLGVDHKFNIFPLSTGRFNYFPSWHLLIEAHCFSLEKNEIILYACSSSSSFLLPSFFLGVFVFVGVYFWFYVSI